MKKILIISNKPTHPTDAGNRWWILSQANLLKNLGNKVHFLYIKDKPLRSNKESYDNSLEQTKSYWGNEFHEYKVPLIQKITWVIKNCYNDLFNNHYYKVDMFYPWGLARYVNKLQKEYEFDICIINYIYLSKLFNKIIIPKKAVATHDCLAYRNLIIGEPVESITASEEAKALQRCDHIFALQDVEANYFQILSPKSHVYRVYGQFAYHPQKIVGNHNLLFLSGNNRYNINGIKWFIYDVFPLIKNRFKDVQLLVGGSLCNVLKELTLPEGIILCGFVNSTDEFYSQGDIAINPVFQGTGLKIKTFEAISYDKVTITHTHSINGIYKKEKSPVLFSNEPKEWVDILEKVWSDNSVIESYKTMNKVYLSDLYDFVTSEYIKFLNS